ncbi:MAG: DUF2933 domain-containing protein [Pseudomonadota bacterium]
MTDNKPQEPWKSAGRRAPLSSWVFAAFAAYAVFLLVTEHRAHAFEMVLYAFASLCVLLLVLHAMHAGVDAPEEASTDPEDKR